MKISVFDLDHTLLTGNSSYHFGFYLYQQKFFSFPKLIVSLSDYARHKCLSLPVQRLHANSFARLFKGRSVAELNGHVENFLNETLDSLVYHPVLQRLNEAQARGDTTMILSSGPDFLVSSIARRFNVAEWQATTYEADQQGRLVDISRVLDGQDKADYLQRYAKTRNIPFSQLTVYTDSYLDLPVLQMAGRPIGVVPDRRLKRICIANGWEIL